MPSTNVACNAFTDTALSFLLHVLATHKLPACPVGSSLQLKLVACLSSLTKLDISFISFLKFQTRTQYSRWGLKICNRGAVIPLCLFGNPLLYFPFQMPLITAWSPTLIRESTIHYAKILFFICKFSALHFILVLWITVASIWGLALVSCMSHRSSFHYTFHFSAFQIMLYPFLTHYPYH